MTLESNSKRSSVLSPSMRRVSSVHRDRYLDPCCTTVPVITLHKSSTLSASATSWITSWHVRRAARHVVGWTHVWVGPVVWVSLRCVVGGHVDVDVDVDMDTRAVQRVRGVRARWVRVGGAGNVMVGQEHVHWCSKHAGGRVVQICWGLRRACRGHWARVCRYGMGCIRRDCNALAVGLNM